MKQTEQKMNSSQERPERAMRLVGETPNVSNPRRRKSDGSESADATGRPTLTSNGDGTSEWKDAANQVLGTVTIFNRMAVIYEWSSRAHGRGNTTRSLELLRRRAPRGIAVVDPGEPGTGSRSYWEHQFDAGRVDALVDENSRVLRQRRDKPFNVGEEAMALAEPPFSLRTETQR